MKKYYLIYKIRNTITNKFYIGAHETHNIDDGYMGSGVYLKRAQRKYGIENFIKEILLFCDTREEMYIKERELIELSENTYNLMPGGDGGWSYARSRITEDTYKKISETMSTPEYYSKTAKQREASAQRLSEMQKDSSLREKQRISLKKTMNDPKWKFSVGKDRSRKISETLKAKSAELMTEERNKKVSEAMKGRICVTLHAVKKRVYPNDPILTDPDIVFGWK